MQPFIVGSSSFNPHYETQLASSPSSPIDQIRLTAALSTEPSLAFTLVLESVLTHFDTLNNDERHDALVLLILSQKTEGDLSISLQDILNVLSTIKNHRNASKETIVVITGYQDKCDLDLVLERGIERYNQEHQQHPVSLKIDWVEVVTHQAKSKEEVKDRIVRHFWAINRNADKRLFIPSEHLLDTLIALILKAGAIVQGSNLDLAMAALKQRSGATNAMKETITDYQECADFGVLIAQAAVRYLDKLNNVAHHQNNFNKLVGHWDIINNEYSPSWKEWRCLAQTCHALDKAFQNEMRYNLSPRGTLEVAATVTKIFDYRAALVKAFPNPRNRIESQILINQKDILYIQQDLKINCGPNMLIAIKTGQLTIQRAKECLHKSEQESEQALRNQFPYLTGAQILALRKYCVDKFLSIQKVAERTQDSVQTLANLLSKPEIQFYCDQIVFESIQPVQVRDIATFFNAIRKSEIQCLINDDVLSPTQLLTATTLHVEALLNLDMRKLIQKKLITTGQIMGLSQLDYDTVCKMGVFIELERITVNQILALTEAGKKFLCDGRMEPLMDSEVFETTISALKEADTQDWLNQYKDQLAALLQRPRQPLQIAQLFKLHTTSQQLLCETKMHALIQSDRIGLNGFMALSEVNQQRLFAHWEILAPLADSNRSLFQRYTLKELVAVIMNDVNFKTLSDSDIKQLIVDGKLPVETLFELSDKNKNYLCESVSLKAFFATNPMKIDEFFKLPALNQQFIESYWVVLMKRVSNKELTLGQIKKSTAADLVVFDEIGVNQYIAHVNGKYPDKNGMIS